MKFRPQTLLTTALVIPILCTLGMSQITQAQNQRSDFMAQRHNLSPEERAAKKAERAAKFKQALNLTDAQATQIKSIRDSYEPQLKALHTEARELRENGASRDQLQSIRSQKKAIREQMYGDIKAELTPEQVQKLEDLKTQRRGRRQRRS